MSWNIKCRKCGDPRAWYAILEVECPNEKCENFTPKQAELVAEELARLKEEAATTARAKAASEEDIAKAYSQLELDTKKSEEDKKLSAAAQAAASGYFGWWAYPPSGSHAKTPVHDPGGEIQDVPADGADYTMPDIATD